MLIQRVSPPAALTTPTRPAEFVCPAFGYWTGIVKAYKESVTLYKRKSRTPLASSCQYAIDWPSGVPAPAVLQPQLFFVDPGRMCR